MAARPPARKLLLLGLIKAWRWTARGTSTSDLANHRIRKVDTAGIISTVAGNGTAGFSGDGGPALSASLNNPTGLALDSAGNLYIADTTNLRVRKITMGAVQ